MFVCLFLLLLLLLLLLFLQYSKNLHVRVTAFQKKNANVIDI